MDIPNALYSSMRFNFLYVDRYIFRENWFYPESYIPYCMLRYMIKGAAVFIIDGEKITVSAGDVAYIPEGCKLECHGASDVVEFISIRFTTTIRLNNNDFLAEFFQVPLLTQNVSYELFEYFQEVYHNATSHQTSRLFRIRGNLELILAALVDQTENVLLEKHERPEANFTLESIRKREHSSSTIKRDPRIQVVVDYLISHPEESFDSEFLSKMADMSPSTLRRLFKEHTGKSPRDFVKDLRMMLAARMLLTSNRRISDIAYEIGIEDINYFSRMFKNVFGITPRKYRMSSRE